MKSTLAQPQTFAPPTPLVGRSSELSAALAHLSSPHVRLLSVTGPAGVGKTRFALEVADKLMERFEDVYWADLSSLSRADEVLPAVMRTAQVDERAGVGALEALTDAFATGKRLLVLDNFEHVLPAAREVDALLRACPDLTALVTTREPLRLEGEERFPLSPLHVPPDNLTDVARLGEVAAVALFVARSQVARASFVLSDANAAAVAALCRSLDGLPLALELAAARSSVLSPHAILERLERRFSLLKRQSADAHGLRRHGSLEAALDWSYDLLSPNERTLFGSLGVFRGGCTLEATLRVAEQSETDVIDGLQRLVECSLLRAEDRAGTLRYSMLTTVRVFAEIAFKAAGDYEAAARRHSEYFLHLAEEAEKAHAKTGDNAQFAQLERDSDNLRVCLVRAVAADDVFLLRLVAALWNFWWYRGLSAEERQWLALALERSAGDRTVLRAKLLRAAGFLEVNHDDLDRATAYLRSSLDLSRALGFTAGVAHALCDLGAVAGTEGDMVASLRLLEEAREHYRDLGDDYAYEVPKVLARMGMAAHHSGDLHRAEAYFSDALAAARTIRYSSLAAYVLTQLGRVHYEQRRFTLSRALLEEALYEAESLGHAPTQRLTWWRLGFTLLAQGNVSRAVGAFVKFLEVAQQVTPLERTIYLSGLAESLFRQGHHTLSVQLYSAADALNSFASTKRTVLPLDLEEHVDILRAELGASAFEDAWNAGRMLDAAHLSETALSVLRREEPPRNALADSLTSREHEVFALMRRGLSNKSVAKELGISVRTVKYHVTAILSKLGVRTRTQAVALALKDAPSDLER